MTEPTEEVTGPAEQANRLRALHDRWVDLWEPVTEPDPAYAKPLDEPSQYAETWLDLSASPEAEREFWEATYAVYPPRVSPPPDVPAGGG